MMLSVHIFPEGWVDNTNLTPGDIKTQKACKQGQEANIGPKTKQTTSYISTYTDIKQNTKSYTCDVHLLTLATLIWDINFSPTIWIELNWIQTLLALHLLLIHSHLYTLWVCRVIVGLLFFKLLKDILYESN